MRCCNATLECLRALPLKFLGGVHIVERSSYLGFEFDPTAKLPGINALSVPTAFAGVLRRLCRVWNEKMARFKFKAVHANLLDEESERVYGLHPTMETVQALVKEHKFKNPERAVMDQIALEACRRYPETSMLWADPLVVALLGEPEEWAHPHELLYQGDNQNNPVFAAHPEGKFRVPRDWKDLSEEERAERLEMVVRKCQELFC